MLAESSTVIIVFGIFTLVDSAKHILLNPGKAGGLQNCFR